MTTKERKFYSQLSEKREEFKTCPNQLEKKMFQSFKDFHITQNTRISQNFVQKEVSKTELQVAVEEELGGLAVL